MWWQDEARVGQQGILTRVRAGKGSRPPAPPCSPELNPVENAWQFLRQNHLSHRVDETCDAILDACCNPWNDLTAEPARITAIASRKSAAVRK